MYCNDVTHQDAKHIFRRTLLKILESYNRSLERRIMQINPSLIVAEGLLTGFTCPHIAKRLARAGQAGRRIIEQKLNMRESVNKLMKVYERIAR